MSLEDSIKELVIKDISSRRTYDLHFYARTNKRVIEFLYNSGIIKNEDLDEALKESVAKTARFDFGLIINKGYWPNHVVSPECLSYAIQHAILSYDDVRRIKFDHGQNASTFCIHYNAERLIPKLREKLLNPPMSYATKSDLDEHPCCC
jgi:hypothetical protein